MGGKLFLKLYAFGTGEVGGSLRGPARVPTGGAELHRTYSGVRADFNRSYHFHYFICANSGLSTEKKIW